MDESEGWKWVPWETEKDKDDSTPTVLIEAEAIINSCASNAASIGVAPPVAATFSPSASTGIALPSHVTAQHVLAVINKHLDVKDQEALEVILATAIAINFPGDPSWLHVVAPPGGGKTEILRAFNGSRVESRDTITPQTLISGLKAAQGKADLLPKLNKKLLIIKDFGSLLSLHQQKQRDIFADLRVAYDGELKKTFGSGVDKGYKATFGLITGATDAIDRFYLIHAQLGERFLRINLQGDNDKAIARALESSDGGEAMRQELSAIMRAFLDSSGEWVDANKYLEQQHIEGLKALAQVTAWLRSPVARDRHRSIVYKPHPEVGTRLVKQLKRLIIGLANIRGTICTTHQDYFTTRRVALSTVPQYRFDIVDVLQAAEALKPGQELTAQAIGGFAEMSNTVVREQIEDLYELRAVTRTGQVSYTWRLTDKVHDLLKKASVNASAEQIQRQR